MKDFFKQMGKIPQETEEIRNGVLHFLRSGQFYVFIVNLDLVLNNLL